MTIIGIMVFACIFRSCLDNFINVVFFHCYLGDSGKVDTSEDREREVIRQRLKEKEACGVVFVGVNEDSIGRVMI